MTEEVKKEVEAKEEEEVVVPKVDNSKTDAEIKKLKAELKESKGAQSRILSERDKAREKLTEFEAQLEEAKTGTMSEVEKANRELEKAQKALEKKDSELLEIQSNHAKMKRDHKISDILGSKIKFLDTIPQEMQKREVEAAFAGIENLDDEDAIEEVVKSFKDNHKGVLVSEGTAKGTGENKSGKVALDGSGKTPDKQTDSERAKYLKNKRSYRKV